MGSSWVQKTMSHHLFQGRDYDRRDDRRDDRGKGKGGKGILAVLLVWLTQDALCTDGLYIVLPWYTTKWQCGLGTW
jgi:hypothetical protein